MNQTFNYIYHTVDCEWEDWSACITNNGFVISCDDFYYVDSYDRKILYSHVRKGSRISGEMIRMPKRPAGPGGRECEPSFIDGQYRYNKAPCHISYDTCPPRKLWLIFEFHFLTEGIRASLTNI